MLLPALVADIAMTSSPAVSPMLCAVGAVHLLTLCSAWFAQLAIGSRYEGHCQLACVALLTVTGTLCGVSFHLGPGTAVASAVTLTVATLIAVADFGGTAGAGDRTA